MSSAKNKSQDQEETVIEYTKYEKARMIGSRACSYLWGLLL